MSPAKAHQDKGNNSKCIESKYLTSFDFFPLILVSLYVRLMSVLAKLFKSCSTQEQVEKGDKSKNVDAKVMYLKRDTSSYPTLSMDVYYNSIRRT